MGDCVHRVVGHLLAMGVPEVERTMTDRIAELRTKMEEWDYLIKSQAPSVSYAEIRAALTKALDGWAAERRRKDESAHQSYMKRVEAVGHERNMAVADHNAMATELAEQERLLVRAKQLAQAVLTLPHRDFIPFAQRLLDDLDARSAT